MLVFKEQARDSGSLLGGIFERQRSSGANGS